MASPRKTGKPNLKRAAAEVLDGAAAGTTPAVAEPEPPKRRGRPPGARTRNRVREPYVATDDGIALCGMVGGTLWQLAGPMIGLRPLTEPEKDQLGRALDPLLWKYLPALGDWQIEFNAVLTVLALVTATRVAKEPNDTREEIGAADDGSERDDAAASGDVADDADDTVTTRRRSRRGDDSES